MRVQKHDIGRGLAEVRNCPECWTVLGCCRVRSGVQHRFGHIPDTLLLLSQVRAALRRMELVEGRMVGHDDTLGNLSIVSSKAEGRMAALQSRQDKLDAKVIEPVQVAHLTWPTEP